ncbi:hypothetical protein LOD99_2106 [Oopsacas minuta]|uniref:Uncharacterized protein n=1 Tax=Oopsacas minuta TaxID=111878 RepID=A0AAV7K340_9METZ|nr:hypothetical protein LOD99_2106 [Oopsacas minuta]
MNQSPYLSKFPPISDDYEFSILDTVPPGTIVDGIEYNSNFETPTSSIPVILENQIRALESDNLITEKQFPIRRLSSSSSIVSNINPTNSTNFVLYVRMKQVEYTLALSVVVLSTYLAEFNKGKRDLGAQCGIKVVFPKKRVQIPIIYEKE